jgi:mono/diheme cytochrome c family protein
MTKTIRSLVVLAAVVSMTGALSFAQSGDATYKSKCAMCHGAAGTPNPTMAKMMGIKSAGEYKADSAAVMTAAVKNGKGKMKPVAGLSDAQVKDVVTYFRSLK